MSKDQDQWDFPFFRNGLTEHEKKLVLAKVMKTSVIAIFKTHIFIWWKILPPGERWTYRPIGLRSTCCIVRLVMMWWDDQLVVALTRLNIKMISVARYMDGIREAGLEVHG